MMLRMTSFEYYTIFQQWHNKNFSKMQVAEFVALEDGKIERYPLTYHPDGPQIEYGPAGSSERNTTTARLRTVANLKILSVIPHMGRRFLSYYTNLERLEFPEGTKVLGEVMLDEATYAELVLPNGLLDLGVMNIRENRNLCTLELPDSVRVIGRGSVSKLSKLTHLRLPRDLGTCSDDCVSKLYRLQTIEWPRALRGVGDLFMSGSISLQHIKLPASLEIIGSAFLAECPSLLTCDMSEARVSIFPQFFLSGCVGLIKLIVRDDQRPDPSNGKRAYKTCLVGNSRRLDIWPLLADNDVRPIPIATYFVPFPVSEAQNQTVIDAMHAVEQQIATPWQFGLVVEALLSAKSGLLRSNLPIYALMLSVEPHGFANFENYRVLVARTKGRSKVVHTGYTFSQYEAHYLARYETLLRSLP